MCKCTPNIRTPYCGRGECVWPRDLQQGTRIAEDIAIATALPDFSALDEDVFPSCDAENP